MIDKYTTEMDKLEFSAPLNEELAQKQKNSEIFPLHMTDISSATTAEVIEVKNKLVHLIFL